MMISALLWGTLVIVYARAQGLLELMDVCESELWSCTDHPLGHVQQVYCLVESFSSDPFRFSEQCLHAITSKLSADACVSDAVHLCVTESSVFECLSRNADQLSTECRTQVFDDIDMPLEQSPGEKNWYSFLEEITTSLQKSFDEDDTAPRDDKSFLSSLLKIFTPSSTFTTSSTFTDLSVEVMDLSLLTYPEDNYQFDAKAGTNLVLTESYPEIERVHFVTGIDDDYDDIDDDDDKKFRQVDDDDYDNMVSADDADDDETILFADDDDYADAFDDEDDDDDDWEDDDDDDDFRYGTVELDDYYLGGDDDFDRITDSIYSPPWALRRYFSSVIWTSDDFKGGWVLEVFKYFTTGCGQTTTHIQMLVPNQELSSMLDLAHYPRSLADYLIESVYVAFNT